MTMLLLLSRFSHVQLCVTPETAAHQAPPSLGFSRDYIDIDKFHLTSWRESEIS